MPNKKNQSQVQDLQEKVSKAQSMVVANFSGLNAAAQIKLRAEVVKAGGQLTVAKNTLFKIATKDAVKEGQEALDKALEDTNAFLFSYDDAVAPIKTLFTFAKENENLKIKVGILDGKVLSFQETEALSKLPTKPELVGQLLSVLNGPARGLVTVLNGPMRGLALALNAIKEKKATA
jgi:large subunit ribosomal protein L10